MKTQEYVKQFKLDVPNYQFNREKFMEAFGQEFRDRIEATITACKKMHVAFTYEKFKHLVKEQQDKFWSISNKKIGEPFTEKLFSAFFAIHVIPIRAELFPNIHAELEIKRQRAIEREKQLIAEEEARKEAEKKMLPVVEAVITHGIAQKLAREAKKKK